MSSFGEEKEGEGERLNMESSLSISHLLNETAQNGGVSPNLFETAPITSLKELDRALSSGSREAASLVEENGDFQMSSDPAGCDSLLFCGNDESASESLDPSSEGWMADCLNDAEIPTTSNELNALGEFDCYFDISELNNLLQSAIDAENSQPQIRPLQFDTDDKTLPPQSTPRASSHLIGERRRVAEKAKAVVYPFALLKPCGVEGDVTLTDINRRISSSFAGIPHLNDSNSSQPLYTSAFTGKPIISRTKIHTEGNGSIILMRTRG